MSCVQQGEESLIPFPFLPRQLISTFLGLGLLGGGGLESQTRQGWWISKVTSVGLGVGSQGF